MMNHLKFTTDRNAANKQILLNKMETKPVGRTEYMEKLARCHDAGLLFCWKVKEGLKRGIDPERVNQYIDFFWSRHLKSHFREEDVLLFNLVDNDLTRQGSHEHQQLAEWFDRILSEGLNSFQEYFSFTDLLTNHIRFEDKVLFPHLVSGLTGGIFGTSGELPIRPSPLFIDNYEDEFWLRNVCKMAKQLL